MAEIDPEKILAAFEAERELREGAEKSGPRVALLVAMLVILVVALLSLWGLMLYLEKQVPAKEPLPAVDAISALSKIPLPKGASLPNISDSSAGCLHC